MMALQGTPGVFDPRNPTVVPNVDGPVAITSASMPPILQLEAPADFVSQTGQTRVNAQTAIIEIGGTLATNATMTVTLTSPLFSGGTKALTITMGATETADTMAEKFTNAINADATLAALGVTAKVNPAGNDEKEFRIFWPGAVGNFPTWAGTASGAGTFTPSSGAFTGGSGPIVPTGNFNFSVGSQMSAFFFGRPYFLSYDVVKAMHDQGMPIS